MVLDVHDLTPDLFALKFGTRSTVARVLRLLERASLRFADAVITVHAQYGSLLAKRGVGPERLYVVLNVPDDRLLRSLSHDPKPAQAGDLRVVYHGTLTERYGIDVLLEAFAGARQELPRLQLSVYGSGEYRQRALRLAAQLGLNGGVEFSPGFVPVDRLLPLLADADIGVVPNRQNPFNERILPTKLMEYAALGLPAIVSQTGLVHSYFTDDMVRYVAPASVDDLRRALLELATDPVARRRLGTNIQRFSREHTWSRNRAELFRAIDGLLPTSRMLPALA
jgi:glycosyltransferase involved in cell wall biosynthesis